MSKPIDTEQDILRDLGVTLGILRQRAGLNLKKASERAEIHWRRLQKIETGQVNVTLSTLVRIALAIGVDASALVGERRQPLRGDARQQLN